MELTVFYCGSKDCTKAFSRVSERSLPKWLRRQFEKFELPIHVTAIETECWDRCEQAACLCLVGGGSAVVLEKCASLRDRDRIIEAARLLVWKQQRREPQS